MASSRRIGAPDAKNRSVLLDAAEQLMVESGYAAV
ncbi:MAG: TetR/AcrR family transcriptional regulator, partial [Rhodococcus sp. (in: high G+C Gram-positive bacteria)]